MIWIIGFCAFIALGIIGFWIASEYAHARSETAAMRQLKAAIQFLKQRKNK
jgi:heme/copper-type cytochrome/quinol oxidase subunit 4